MHEARTGSRSRPVKILVGVFVVGIVALTALATSAMGRPAGKTISVAIVANPQMTDIASLTPSLYASPFYAESSFMMYRKDVLKSKGVTMPARPTWDQVAAIARKINSRSMAGICLRGKPGWGDLGAAFTTVLNTFGGTWWSSTPD